MLLCFSEETQQLPGLNRALQHSKCQALCGHSALLARVLQEPLSPGQDREQPGAEPGRKALSASPGAPCLNAFPSPGAALPAVLQIRELFRVIYPFPFIPCSHTAAWSGGLGAGLTRCQRRTPRPVPSTLFRGVARGQLPPQPRRGSQGS